MRELTRKEYQTDKELNAWALGCLHSLARAKRKDRTKLIQKYREEIVEKVIEASRRIPVMEEIVKVWDCRHKDLMILRRKRGDLAIEFYDANGKYLFSEWYQMKKPYKETFEKIVKLFSEMKDLLLRQD